MNTLIKEETRFINIYSSDGVSQNDDSTFSNMVFNFKSIVQDLDDNVDIKVCIDNAQFPYSFYNINVNNNILNYTYLGISYTMFIIPGNYNEYTLANQLTSQFLLNGSIFVITFSKLTGKMTFTSTSNFTFLPSSIFPILGFKMNVNYSSTLLNLTGVYPMSILGTRKLKICSDKLSLNNMDSFSKSQSIIQFIPVNCQPFGMVLFNNPTDKQCTIKSTTIDEVDIKILDDTNHFIDFNGVNWCITLAITVFKKMNQQENTSTFHSITNRNINESDFYDNDLQFLLYQNGIFLT